jgi:hypothetical protein
MSKTFEKDEYDSFKIALRRLFNHDVKRNRDEEFSRIKREMPTAIKATEKEICTQSMKSLDLKTLNCSIEETLKFIDSTKKLLAFLFEKGVPCNRDNTEVVQNQINYFPKQHEEFQYS